MKKTTLVGVALLGILVGTQIAVAGNTECTGPLSGVLITDDLDVPAVPAGKTCELSGVIVTGNVTVEGTFVTFMGGNLQGNQTSGITLSGSTVIGNLQANQTNGLYPRATASARALLAGMCKSSRAAPTRHGSSRRGSPQG
jgi:hypothetical protein